MKKTGHSIQSIIPIKHMGNNSAKTNVVKNAPKTKTGVSDAAMVTPDNNQDIHKKNQSNNAIKHQTKTKDQNTMTVQSVCLDDLVPYLRQHKAVFIKIDIDKFRLFKI